MQKMQALTFDLQRESWNSSTGFVKEEVERPTLTTTERDSVIIQMHYAGFCGSDRGIWWRKAFGDMIIDSLKEDSQHKRIIGHELLGKVIAIGPDVTRVKIGDMVTVLLKLPEKRTMIKSSFFLSVVKR